MSDYIAELEEAVKESPVTWVPFPDRAQAHAVGVQDGYGYHLTVYRLAIAPAWNWVAHTGAGAPIAGVAFSAVEALNAADAEYARAAAEAHDKAVA